MERDRFGTSVELGGGEVVVRLDLVTVEWLWDALYALGEHVAAGVKIETMPSDMSERLGSLMGQLSKVVHSSGGDVTG